MDGCFRKIGPGCFPPKNHPFWYRVFHYFKPSILGYPYFWNHTYVTSQNDTFHATSVGWWFGRGNQRVSEQWPPNTKPRSVGRNGSLAKKVCQVTTRLSFFWELEWHYPVSKIEEDISINLGLLYDFLEKKSVQKCGLQKNTRQKKGHFKVHPVNVDFPTIQGPTSCRTQMEQTFQVSQFGIFNSTHPKPIFFAKKFETQKPVFSLTRFCPLKAGQKPLMKTLKFRLLVLRVGGAFPQLYLNGQPEEVEDSARRRSCRVPNHIIPPGPKKKVCVWVEDLSEPSRFGGGYVSVFSGDYINVNKSKSQHFLQHFVGRLLNEVWVLNSRTAPHHGRS